MISCKECEKVSIKANYYGESNFSGYTCGVQHIGNYRSNNPNTQEKSALRRHAKELHGDMKVAYKMEVLQTFTKPLSRQVMESIHIIKSKEEDHFPLNSKTEFNQALIVTAKYAKGCH